MAAESDDQAGVEPPPPISAFDEALNLVEMVRTRRMRRARVWIDVIHACAVYVAGEDESDRTQAERIMKAAADDLVACGRAERMQDDRLMRRARRLLEDDGQGSRHPEAPESDGDTGP